jgi:DNA/RNA endonuclease YhcR with UshA esterase domain
MKAQLHSLMVTLTLLSTAATPAFAHHPFASEFDANKPVTLTGTITKVDWTNPHSFVYLDVKNNTGAVANWKVELAGPVALTNRGWSRSMLKTGEQVTVEGWQAKDGGKVANAKSFKLPDGKTLSAASSFGQGKKKASTH